MSVGHYALNVARLPFRHLGMTLFLPLIMLTFHRSNGKAVKVLRRSNSSEAENQVQEGMAPLIPVPDLAVAFQYLL